MASVIVATVAGAMELVQAASDAGSFIRSFVAQSGYVEPLPLTDDELHVDLVVLANEIEVIAETRATARYRVPINIGIRKRLTESEQEPSTGGPSQTEINELTELTEQLLEYFFHSKVASNAAHSTGPATITTLAPSNKLEEYTQFFAVIRVVFQKSKTVT